MLTTSVSRPSRSRIHGDTVLGTVRIIAQLAKDVTDIVEVPFASEAASRVLSLLGVAEGVKEYNDARVRLAITAATYLIELRPILDPQDSTYDSDIPPELRLRLERFHHSLTNLKDYLEAMEKRIILKHIFRNDQITMTLPDHEKALQDSYNALQLWITANTYVLVRKAAKDSDTDGISRFDQAEVSLMGNIKANSGLFSELQCGELRAKSDRQRVLVKRFANKAERDYDAKKWRKLRYENLPQIQIAGWSSDRDDVIAQAEHLEGNSDGQTQVPYGELIDPRRNFINAENDTRETRAPSHTLQQIFLALVTPYTIFTLPVLLGFLIWKAYAVIHSQQVANTLDWIIGIVLLVIFGGIKPLKDYGPCEWMFNSIFHSARRAQNSPSTATTGNACRA